MAELILRDAEGHEVGRRPMEPQERYVYYQAWSQHDLVPFDGKRYKLHSVAWRKPSEDCILLVSFDSDEPVMYCDD